MLDLEASHHPGTTVLSNENCTRHLFAHAKPMVLLCTHVCHLNDVMSKRRWGSLVQEAMQCLVLASVYHQSEPSVEVHKV